jgi:catechol 2,3-dioxygenase-like lactoylglutathione lyase family enzyme
MTSTTEAPDGRPATDFPRGVAAITLFVDDLAATEEFYGRAFDVSPIFQGDTSVVFRFGSTIINLLQVASADELITPAAVGSSADGARFQLTIEVDDVDATCARLAERGVELLNGPMDRPWGIRTAAFRDPSGHVWEIAA